jgi:hypothetical protein
VAKGDDVAISTSGWAEGGNGLVSTVGLKGPVQGTLTQLGKLSSFVGATFLGKVSVR